LQEVSISNARQEIVEKIVEREVIKEVKVGISEEEMEELNRKMEAEKAELMKKAQEDMLKLIDTQSRTAQERADLKAALEKEAADKRAIEEQKLKLQSKLKVSRSNSLRCSLVACKCCCYDRVGVNLLRLSQSMAPPLARQFRPVSLSLL
jgi:hypothetical protein